MTPTEIAAGIDSMIAALDNASSTLLEIVAAVMAFGITSYILYKLFYSIR